MATQEQKDPGQSQPGQDAPAHADINPERPETRIPRVGTATSEEEE
jgi:hypothetical protein